MKKVSISNLSGIKGAVGSALATANSALSSVAEIVKRKEESSSEKKDDIVYKDSGEVSIQSLQGMESFLESNKATLSPALQQTIQTQLQVLSFVQSPALTGMAVDNMLFCLDKSIKEATNEDEKNLVREQFCSMIQTFVFFMEARILQLERSTRKQGEQLLMQAGEMLSKNVSNIALQAIAPHAKAIKKIIVNNVFEDPAMIESFTHNALSWLSDKKQITSKRKDFDRTLQDMFVSFDHYYPLIGNSILIHGMLTKYTDQLVDRYEEELKETDRKEGRKGEVSMASASAILDLFSINPRLEDQLKKSSKIDIDMLFSLQASAHAELSATKHMVEQYKNDMDSVADELAATSAFSFKKKSELSQKLEACRETYERSNNKLRKQESIVIRIDELLAQYAPSRVKIAEFRDSLERVANKYAMNY